MTLRPTKDLKMLTDLLKAEGIPFEVRQSKKHFQVFVDGKLAFTRSMGSKGSAEGFGCRPGFLRTTVRRIKQERENR